MTGKTIEQYVLTAVSELAGQHAFRIASPFEDANAGFDCVINKIKVDITVNDQKNFSTREVSIKLNNTKTNINASLRYSNGHVLFDTPVLVLRAVVNNGDPNAYIVATNNLKNLLIEAIKEDNISLKGLYDFLQKQEKPQCPKCRTLYPTGYSNGPTYD